MKVGDRVTLKKGAIASDGWEVTQDQKRRLIVEIKGNSIRLRGDAGLWFWKKDIKLEEPQQDTIVESVINQFRERSEVGIKKYGVTLDREDLSSLEWINHAQQEAMDFVLYLEKLKQTL